MGQPRTITLQVSDQAPPSPDTQVVREYFQGAVIAAVLTVLVLAAVVALWIAYEKMDPALAISIMGIVGGYVSVIFVYLFGIKPNLQGPSGASAWNTDIMMATPAPPEIPHTNYPAAETGWDKWDYLVVGIFGILVVLNVGDVVSTYIALTGSGFHEANPIAAWVFNSIGLVPGLILGKLASLTWTAVGAYLAAYRYPQQEDLWDQRSAVGMAVAGIILGLVVWHNFSLLGYL